MTSALWSWFRGVALGLVVLALLLVAGFLVVDAGIAEHYSPGWYSASSAEAEREGILVRRVVVVPDSLAYEGAGLRVADAWIEQVTHVEAPLWVFRRTVRDSTLRLIVVGRRAGSERPDSACYDRLLLGPGDWVGSSGTWERPVHVATRYPHPPPFADTIRVVAERGTCTGDPTEFAPFDSTTLVARCRHRVRAAEDSAWRAVVARVGGRDGVLVYANPAPPHPCFQLGVPTVALRDTLIWELRRANVPSHLVTFFRVRQVPEDDIVAGAR